MTKRWRIVRTLSRKNLQEMKEHFRGNRKRKIQTSLSLTDSGIYSYQVRHWHRCENRFDKRSGDNTKHRGAGGYHVKKIKDCSGCKGFDKWFFDGKGYKFNLDKGKKVNFRKSRKII